MIDTLGTTFACGRSCGRLPTLVSGCTCEDPCSCGAARTQEQKCPSRIQIQESSSTADIALGCALSAGDDNCRLHCKIEPEEDDEEDEEEEGEEEGPTCKISTRRPQVGLDDERCLHLLRRCNCSARRSKTRQRSRFRMLRLKQSPVSHKRLSLPVMNAQIPTPPTQRRLATINRCDWNASSTIVKYALVVVVAANNIALAQQMASDPRPTIYSGQVSFGLLLSAHSSLGAEMSTSASHQVNSLLAVGSSAASDVSTSPATSDKLTAIDSSQLSPLETLIKPRMAVIRRPNAASGDEHQVAPSRSPQEAKIAALPAHLDSTPDVEDLIADASEQRRNVTPTFELNGTDTSPEDADELDLDHDEYNRGESRKSEVAEPVARRRQNRQIFDRSHFRNLRQQHKQQQERQRQRTPSSQSSSSSAFSTGKSGGGGADSNGLSSALGCNQINPSALYAGMSAIWASHQANLVGDSSLTIGTYVYDSCNDLDVGQRQAVRIVSNLNAFQQTTCEAPRGSPISLTIAHGDQQLRAIQLLTSFKVPVITTKEHFALEDYHQLTRDQKRFLLSTAHSSRHLALGALRFAKRVVSRTIVSPKLPNQFNKMSSKNGLIVISRNLPARFISFLVEIIPNHVNYEILQSSQPIDQVRSIESVESIMGSKGGFASGSSPVSESTGASSPIMDSLAPSGSHPASNVTAHTYTSRSKRAYSQPDDTSDSASSNEAGLSSTGGSSSDSDGSNDSSSSSSTRMLSPTILMFITPAEAIDLVTRLRNDLAEVSQYYSLIVSTREDISPALRTIFHRGGSRLCSGKAFYTISPKPDDIGEFSRYFRDTIQMEGEASDHPLITEFAKFQSTSKISADLDDISTEPVIKAVWAAAAAFKMVHRRECGSLSSSSASSASSTSSDLQLGSPGDSHSSPKRQVNGSGSGGGNQKSAQQECLTKMNKNMSTLVQRTLKRLDVYINSTGLQAFDGFRIKFDELNELMTNTFSIKYINKECELAEIGEYTGFKDSQLLLDEEMLHKSLESALPDPWPMRATPPTASTTDSNQSSNGSGGSTGSGSADSDSGSDGGLGNSSSNGGSSIGADKNDASASEEAGLKSGDGHSDQVDLDPADIATRRQRKRSKSTDQLVALLDQRYAPKSSIGASQMRPKSQTKKANPVTTVSGGRGFLPGVIDTTDTPFPSSQRDYDEATIRALRAIWPTTTTVPSAAQKPMRKVKPFPVSEGTTLSDWIPRTESSQPSPPPTTTTLRGSYLVGRDHTDAIDLQTRASTTQAPAHSTPPESGGNSDLDSTPAVKPSRTNSSSASPNDVSSASQITSSTSHMRNGLDTAATTESSDYITIVPDMQHSSRAASPSSQYRSQPSSYVDLLNHTLSPVLDSSAQVFNNEQPIIRVNSYLRDLHTSPVPLASTTPTSAPSGLAVGSYDHTSTYSSSANPLDPSSARYVATASPGQNLDLKLVKSRLRWTHSSWFAMLILGANICGALLTLYVLTFLLMKNCDGSLSRENQTIRSMYLLAIIVMLFGSTLFIAYPTPGLCLLRTSWHNFALVMIFGSLLLQTMQTRSLHSLGLGGRANRLNQFLTLVFIVAVQVSFELQRWRYESTNYINFINQYLSPTSTSDYNIMAVNSFMNPLNTLNDQFRPVSIQISEKYQTLLHDCCSQQDLLQSQFYLWFILCLLTLFNITIRRQGLTKNSSHHRIKSRADALSVFSVTLVCVPIYCLSIVLHVHGQNIINRDIVSSLTLVTIAFVTLIGIFLPIMRQMHRREGQALISKSSPTSSTSTSTANNNNNNLNQSSATESTSSSTSSSSCAINAPGQPTNSNNANLMISGGAPIDVTTAPTAKASPSSRAKSRHQHSRKHNNINGVFTMFPEFAPTGLRRPASLSGDSLLAGHNTRHRFKDSKESRKQMGVALANLSPSADSLRGMGLMNSGAPNLTPHRPLAMHQDNHPDEQHIDHAMLNLKLNIAPHPKGNNTEHDDVSLSCDLVEADLCKGISNATRHHQHHDQRNSQQYDRKHRHEQEMIHRRSTNDAPVDTGGGNERRLVMLDVDPYCPRHGGMKATTSGANFHNHRHGL